MLWLILFYQLTWDTPANKRPDVLTYLCNLQKKKLICEECACVLTSTKRFVICVLPCRLALIVKSVFINVFCLWFQSFGQCCFFKMTLVWVFVCVDYSHLCSLWKTNQQRFYSCSICFSSKNICHWCYTLTIYVHYFYFVKNPPLPLQSSIKYIFSVLPQLWVIEFSE